MLEQLKNETNYTLTENMAVARKTTKNSLLDFFAQAGALRTRNAPDKVAVFDAAFAEEPLLAMKALFYFRDIRGGQGERQTFKDILRYLGNHKKELVVKNFALISEFGRWDDYYILEGTACNDEMFAYLHKQLLTDLNVKVGEPVSLLAKWLKSENATSPETKRLATITRKSFGMDSKRYRKSLSVLRKAINVIEITMSNKEWKIIDYEKVPSRAGMIYRKAFLRNDKERYEEFLEQVDKGEKKINATTLYPYDIVDKVLHKGDTSKTIDALWKALPNYVEEQEPSLAVVDTSGSMYGHPITVSVGLGLYLAERNKGAYHNHFITFSERPELQEVRGTTIASKIANLGNAAWGYNTNIEAVFDLILGTAIKNRVPDHEMVRKLYVISDMEFDRACGYTGNQKTLIQKMKQKYDDANVYFPQLVFWNVNARNKQYPATVNDAGIQMVSGSSPSLFRQLMTGEFKSAYDLMLEVLNQERYEKVQV